MSLGRQLLVGALLVVAVTVMAVLYVAARPLGTRLEQATATRLAREARLIGAEWSAGADPQRLAERASSALSGDRVTLLAADRVRGDSDWRSGGLSGVDPGADELQQLDRDSVGIARRESSGTPTMFVAVRTDSGIVRIGHPLHATGTLLSETGEDIALASLVGVILAFIVAALYARSVSRPITELRNVAQGLAAGDLTRRPTLAARGEVGDLATAVHGMAGQLALRMEALQAEDNLLSALIESLNEGVVAVDPRRRVVRINRSGRRLLGVRDQVPFPADHLPRERALRDALEDALSGRATPSAEVRIDERTLALTARPLPDGGAVLALFDLTPIRRLETVRRDFVANVSHELKTPLTVVSGFAETLTDDAVSAEQRHQFAQAIRSNTRRMQRIVDDLLDLSRIESGGWRPNPVSLDLHATAAESLESLRASAAAREVQLAIELAPDARTVHADPTAVRQVLDNLVENAVRASKAGDTVTVRSRRDAVGVWVEVEDAGIGIGPEHLPRIFERFYRVDRGRSREAGGTGLGLSIVRHLAEAHGGRVEAMSTLGRGTRVGVLFPRAAEGAAEAP